MTVEERPRGFVGILKQVPVRLVEIVVKIISYRTVVLVVTVWLVVQGHVGEYAFVILAGVAIFGRDFLKVVGNIKK